MRVWKVSAMIANARSWCIASCAGGTLSLIVSTAIYVSTYTFSGSLVALNYLSSKVATIGILGLSVGMIASGNAHSGGPLTIVLAVTTIVNCGLYTLIVYAVIRMFSL